MSTRSYIAIQNPTTKEILATYVHSDGYPDGVGHCLIKNYNSFDKAINLFNYGQASYLGSTIEECCFYHRDMGRELETTENYKKEWFLMNSLKGDSWIEYIYLFKDNQWLVSSLNSLERPDDIYPEHYISYCSKFIPVQEHKNYTGKHEGITEVKMIGSIMKVLKQSDFKDDDIVFQGGKINKLNS